MKQFFLQSAFFIAFFTSSFLSASALASISTSNINLVPSGLVGYWNFDGKNMTNATATDVSGNGNNGALIGMTTASSKTIGKLGQALTFDAADDKINMGTPSALNITSTITISAWIYPRSYGDGSNGRIIVNKNGDATSGYTLFMDNTNRANSITFCTNTCVGPVGTPNVITLNRWQHVVVIQSATTLTHYVNGVQVYSGAAIAAPLTSSNNFVIGGRTTDQARNFDGMMDDVRVYNRDLPEKEVQALYKVGQVAAVVSPTINTNSGAVGINNGLVGHFTFDGKNMTNATATDVSGNGNNGALIGMTTASSKTIGKLGQALTFSSSSLSYVSVPQNGRYNITTTAFTVSFWVKNDTPSSGVSTTFHRFISWYDGTSNVQVGLANATTPANTRQYYVFNSNVNALPSQVTAINGGVSLGWHHVTATFNGSTYTLYVDSVANGGGTTINPVAVFTGNSTTLYIGQRGDNVAATFTTGPIDDVRFYNRALSPIEVKSLYKLGSQ